MSEKKLINIPIIQGHQIIRQLGMYCSTSMGVELYYYFNVYHLLISCLGEEFYKKELEKINKDWEKVKRNLIKLEKKVMAVKTFYDALEDKRFERKNKEKEIKRYFIKVASKIPTISQDLYDVVYIGLINTTLHRQTIPADAFRILEHKVTRIDLARKPIQSEIKNDIGE